MFQVALGRGDRVGFVVDQPTNAVSTIAAVDLGHVQRHVNQPKRTIPCQRHVGRRQRHGDIAYRYRAPNNLVAEGDWFR